MKGIECNYILIHTITTMIRVLVLNNYVLSTTREFTPLRTSPLVLHFKRREARRRRRDITIYSVKLDRVTYSTITSQYHLPFTKKKTNVACVHYIIWTHTTLPILLFLSPFTPKKKLIAIHKHGLTLRTLPTLVLSSSTSYMVL